MSTLKELTWTAHKRAEGTPLMQLLLNNTISDKAYCDLVYTKYEIYKNIESRLTFKTPCLKRMQAALNDWQGISCSLPRSMRSFDSYVNRLRVIGDYQLWAHAYVHYLAPLYGGQIIKKRIEGRFPVSMYEFDDAPSAIAEIRSKITIDMAEEANSAFDATADYYQELYLQHYPS